MRIFRLLAEVACLEIAKLRPGLNEEPTTIIHEDEKKEAAVRIFPKQRKMMMCMDDHLNQDDDNPESSKLIHRRTTGMPPFKKGKTIAKDSEKTSPSTNVSCTNNKKSKKKVEKEQGGPHNHVLEVVVVPEPEATADGWFFAEFERMRSTKYPRRIDISTKQLSMTDVGDHYPRIFLRVEDVRQKLIPGLLFSQEIEKGALKTGIKVVDPDMKGRQWKLRWKFWTGKYHLLDGQWMNLVNANRLQALHTVHVYAFRFGVENSSICITIDHRAEEGKANSMSNSASASACTSQSA